ncbi:MAG: MATE family efflux transporter [Gracilibacteraceae bacterium]|jgi:putative MATE family efflux protein|nr:MATE family efflux transporter [Gracilibacteraceae bacterium]
MISAQEELGAGKIGKILWKYSLPAIVGMMVSSAYNIISRVFVGQTEGMLALSGVAVAYPVNIIIIAFSMLITIGATALISIKLGEKNPEDAERIIGTSFVALIAISLILVFFIVLFLEPVLRLLGATDDIMPFAKEFMIFSLLGIPFIGLGYGMNNFIRAAGNPRKAMVTQIVGAIVSVGLTALLVYVLRLGVKGAALAAVCAQALAAALVLQHLLSPRSGSALRLRLKYIRIEPRLLRGILSVGVAPFAAQAAASLVLIFFNNRLKIYGGDAAIAAYAAINGIMMVLVMPVMGMAQGVQPIVGFNFGARKYDRVKKAEYSAMMIATLMTILGFLLAELFPQTLIRFFGGDESFTGMGVHGLRVFMAMYAFVGMQIMGSQYFQATGRGAVALVLTLTRQCIFLLPALFILPYFFGLQGIWLAGPVSDTFAGVVTMILFARDMKRLSREQRLLNDGGRNSEAKSEINQL